MFDFLLLGLYHLWKKLLVLLRSHLDKRGRTLIARFKELLASTLDDLGDAIVERVDKDDLWKLWAEETIKRRGSNDDAWQLTLRTFPLDRLCQTPTIVPVLIEKLKANVELEAARNEAGISDAEWDNLLHDYSQCLVEYGVTYAIERMIKQKKEIWAGGIVLLVQKRQAFRVNGTARHLDMVKVYHPPYSNSDKPSVKRAHSMWDSRSKPEFEWSKEEYNDSGFTPKSSAGR